MESSDDSFLHYRISNVMYTIDPILRRSSNTKKKKNNKRALNMI